LPTTQVIYVEETAQNVVELSIRISKSEKRGKRVSLRLFFFA
jgi:hypothetical protein